MLISGKKCHTIKTYMIIEENAEKDKKKAVNNT